MLQELNNVWQELLLLIVRGVVCGYGQFAIIIPTMNWKNSFVMCVIVSSSGLFCRTVVVCGCHSSISFAIIKILKELLDYLVLATPDYYPVFSPYGSGDVRDF